MIKYILTRFGYVESNTVGLIAWTIEDLGFYDKESALDSLAKFLFFKYKEDRYYRDFNQEDFSWWLSGLVGTTSDTFGEWDLIEGCDIWNPWSFPIVEGRRPGFYGWPKADEVISIGEKAEVVLYKSLKKQELIQ